MIKETSFWIFSKVLLVDRPEQIFPMLGTDNKISELSVIQLAVLIYWYIL